MQDPIAPEGEIQHGAPPARALPTLRAVRREDAAPICAIYNYYIEHTTITFEEEALSAAAMRARIATVTEQLPWLVLERDAELLAYAYAAPWKDRSAYRFTAESTVYCAPAQCRSGHGMRLYGALIEAARARQVHRLIGGIALPNAASVALHERLGFRPAGRFSEVGWKFGRWVDVGYWERVL